MDLNAEVAKIAQKYFLEHEIESVKIFGDRIIVTLVSEHEENDKAQALKQELLSLENIKKVNVVFTKQKTNVSMKPEIEKWVVPGVKKIIGVASGKGGVGKSTTATNLALALVNCGLKVALFDADIYGPSIPTMLGYEGMPTVSYDGKNFEPFDVLNLKSISIGTLIDRNTPLIWRGAKACGAIEQLMTQTNWGEIDVMVIDMPPGTGDIQITLSQRINMDGIVIVSTPQDIALIDAIKGVNMFKKVNVPILGIVENMSYYICEKCGNRADIFGHHGAKKTAEDMGETFLGEIPLHLEIRENADRGTPIVYADPFSVHTKAYEEIAQKIKSQLF